MSTQIPGGKYQRDVSINEPGIVGARWWNRSLIEYDKSQSRRKVLKTIAIAGGVALFVGLAVKGIADAGDGGDNEDVSLALKKSIEMQRQYGWDFGARGQALVYDGVKLSPFDRSKLADLAAVMLPLDADHRAFHRPTLTESLGALPTATLPPDPQSTTVEPAFAPLKDVLVPAESQAMKAAYYAGEALARLAAGRETVDGKRLGLLVDMAGPESVAFAAGAADVFEPVLLFDNWPHPKGVVAAHDTLAALAFYQPRFQAARSTVRKWPAFVLDRGRHATYSDASDRFDNRYYARFPTADALRAKGITQILYVVPGGQSTPEPPDLNVPLSELVTDAVAPAVGARVLSAADFQWSTAPPLTPTPTPSASASPSASAPLASSSSPPPSGPKSTMTYFGGRPDTDATIWSLYPVFKYTRPDGTTMLPSTVADYRFRRNAVATQTEPTNFGVVGVMVVAGTGLIVAAALNRAGSMNRFSGGWSG